jgi:hypothetical protein
MIRKRPAPNAERTAISFCRAAARTQQQVGHVCASGTERRTFETSSSRKGVTAAPLEPSYDGELVIAPVPLVEVGGQRRHDVRPGGVNILPRDIEISWQNPNHGDVPPVQYERLPQNAGVSAEAPLPQAIADQGHRRGAGPVLFRREQPAHGWPDAQQGQYVLGDTGVRQPLRLCAFQPAKFGIELVNWGDPSAGLVSLIATRRPASRKGSERNSTALTTLKMALLAPMPRASVRIATAVNPGVCAGTRNAHRTS